MKKILQRYWFLVTATIMSSQAFAQTTVSGTVTDAKRETMIGVSVQLKGTVTGVITDNSGKYTLQIPANAGEGILVFSFIGYATQEIAISNQSIIDVTLAEDFKALEEVVVTGYQSEERKKILGAVSTVSPDLIVKVPVSGIDQAIQGRIPGVVVTQNTGAPGEGVVVRVRGVGSLNSRNDPLYIIDGLPTLDATFLAPQDIESLTVLKDASASVIYGARAANGVILITTKSGSARKMTINYNMQMGVQSPVRLVPMASTKQYVSIYNEAANNDNPDFPSFLQRPLISQQISDTLPNVNQVGAIFRPNAILQTHNLSFSGTEGKTKYLISGTYYKQEGTITSSDFKRLTGRVNVESTLNKWLKAGVNINVSGATTDLVGSSGDGAGGNGGSVIRYAYFRSPAIPIVDKSGNFVDKPALYNFFGDGYNPVGMLAYNQNKRITDRIFGRFYLNLNPIEGLTITSSSGVDFTTQNQRRFDRTWGTANRINGTNRLVVQDDRNYTLTFSNFATYKKTIDAHSFTILAGTEAIQNEWYTVAASDTQFDNQSPVLVYLGNGKGLKSNSESRSRSTLLSYFGKVNYDYQEKYLASATVRRDGSSRFGPRNRYATFYAGSLGWRIDKESFLLNNSSISRLLARVAYGVIGNQEIANSNYPFSDSYSVTNNYPFGNATNVGYAVSQLGNANIKWESSTQFNSGVDVVLLDGKFSGSLDYFVKTTSDLITNQPIALSAGLAGSPYVNNGKILNRGLELSMSYTNKIGNFNYTISPNGAVLHNEVLAINSPIFDGKYGGAYITQTDKGSQVGSFYMYEMQGLFQNATDVFTHAVQGPSSGPSRIQPGDVKFKDQNGDGVIDAKDRIHAGSAIPKVSAGLNLAVSYKGWDLSVFFQGAYGQKIMSVLNRDIEGFYRPFNVTERYFQHHWTGEGTSNVFPRASWSASQNNTQLSTRFLEDGSYTRLKNIQVGYSVPKQIVGRYGLQSVRIYFSGTNLFTWSKYSGMDPEMSVSNNSAGSADKAFGIDWGTYPAAKSYNVGLNVSF